MLATMTTVILLLRFKREIVVQSGAEGPNPVLVLTTPAPNQNMQ
jgi:hypothetical protein